jgi:hypothetical protein
MQRKERFPKNCDIIFVTALGIVRVDEKIPLSNIPMTLELAESIRSKNLEFMRRILKTTNYDEIYVNLGQKYLHSIKGFEMFTNTKITYATGVLGQKSVHMKNWITAHI